MSTIKTSAKDNLAGIILMVLGAGVLLVNDAMAKLLAERFGVGQVVTLRQSGAIVIILCIVGARGRWRSLVPRNSKAQLLRGLSFLGTAWLMVTGLSLLPLPVVTAIAFSSPFVVAVLSLPILGERVSRMTWMAIAIGFVGVVVIIGPGSSAFSWVLLIPVMTSIAIGFRDLLTRYVGRWDDSLTTLFWSSVVVVALSAPIAVLGEWLPLSASDWLWFALASALNAGAHFLMIEALRRGEAAVVAPFRYSALVWSIALGWWIWGDLPTWAIAIGATVVAASGVVLVGEQQRR